MQKENFNTPDVSAKPTNWQLNMLCLSLSLFVCLSIIRTGIIYIEWQIGYSLLTYIPRALLAAYYDFCFVGVLTVFFSIILFLAEKKNKYIRSVQLLYYTTVFLTLLLGFFNKQIFQIINNPFSYQWYHYSDLMASLDSRHAISANISWKLFGEIALISCLLLVLARLFFILWVHLSKRYTLSSHPRVHVLAGIIFIIYSFAFFFYKDYKKWQYNQLAHPVIFFVKSALQYDKAIPLFSMELTSGFEDLPDTSKTINNTSLEAENQKITIKNVVIFVLESVPAEYIDVYGGQFNVTPEINKLLPQSVWFKHIYAHSPATNNSMVSILGSVYPWISYKSLTKEYPGIKLHTLNTALKQNNFRTAFFNAGDIKFQRANEFLTHQQFDKIEDYTSKHCKNKQFILQGERWDNPDGADDGCLIESFAEWMDTDPERPFFATLWTVQTHYPYFFSGKEKDYQVNNPDLNRYLNALHHSDQTLGRLMDVLQNRGLDESTLVVIVGDHGEAFGRHQQYTHASKIYEENVHVPLIFVNKNLFHGENKDNIGGHVDIAPTIMDLLNFPVNKHWQGQSLFSNHRNNRTYFFAPWSDFLFGYRENNFKFIYNATKNIAEVYDLEKDPTETINLVNQLPSEYITTSQQRLAAWIQYHDQFMKTSIEK